VTTSAVMALIPSKRCFIHTFWLGICCTLSACGGGSVLTPARSENLTNTAVDVPPISPAAPPDFTGWKLVWSDEFDINGLPDSKKWDYDTSRNLQGWYNNELQYYARDRLENARVENGKLIVTALKEKLTSASDYGNQAYTSARLITRGKSSWTYGFFEVRAKLPCGTGTWPAIWTLGSKGSWPDDGEIDLMEQTGQNKAQVLGTVHTRANNFSNGTQGPGLWATTTVTEACTSFHNYQLIWTADQIAIGVDGVNYFTYSNPKNNSYNQWPFDNPQYLILNLAVGGDLGGPVPTAFTPQQMEVEYVRVYQK
jgi:beta-glucanase (GH16 family)